MDQREPPSPLWIAKAVLAIVGIGVFGAGIRWDSSAARWVGIAVVAVAWVLRFVKAPATDQAPEADQR